MPATRTAIKDLPAEQDSNAEASLARLSPSEMVSQAQAAANFLKALAHEGRLMILCQLSTGEKSVTELEALLGARQAAVSQQLARLRLEGLVTSRRDGKAIHYSLHDPRAARLVGTVYDLFCTPGAQDDSHENTDPETG